MPAALVFVLPAFCAGVVALSWCAELPSRPLAVAALGIGAVAVAWRANQRSTSDYGRHARLALAIVGAAVIGFGYAAWRSHAVLADELPREWEGEDVVIVGIVDELPRAALGGVRFAFAVERVDTPEARVPDRVSIAWYAAARAAADDRPEDGPNVPAVHAGERWSLTVRLVRPHGSVNPAGFDLEAWLFAHGLRANGYVRPEGANRRIDAFAARPRDYVERERERIRERIYSSLPNGDYAGVLAALTVGDQRAIPEAQWTLFNRTGIAHLISISGLHVTVFATLAGGIAYALFRRWPRITTLFAARRVAVLFGLVASAGYVALAGAEVPALRTLAMLTVAAIGLWLARPGTGRTVWLWALTAVLAVDPWAPLAPGFWLSFAAVAMLIYAMGARLADSHGGWRIRVTRAMAAAARTQWIVTVGLVPFTLALFGQFSLVSPIANAVAIPLVTFVVVPLALLAAVIPVEALWLVAHGALALLVDVLEPLAALPAAVWAQHAPAPWTVVAGTAAVMLLLAPPAFPGRVLGIVWMLPLFAVAPLAPLPGRAVVTVLDVGQGLAVTVRTRSHALLYDTGPRYSPGADAGGRIVAPFLRGQGMSQLSMLMVTHADIDHSGGALSILSTVPVAEFSSSLPSDHSIVRRMQASGGAGRCEAGQRWDWDGVRFSVLHPPPGAYEDPSRKTNDLSCVLRIETPHGTVLLTGDVEARSEHELLGRDAAALRADVLVMPHHGSRTSSTPAFVAAVAPRRAIIAAGYRNRFGPRADVVARYTAHGVAISRTDTQGAVIVTLAPGGVDVIHAREALRRYWHARDPPP